VAEADLAPEPDSQPHGLGAAVAVRDPRYRFEPNRLTTFRFVQFEFPWPLGPADGRYLAREAPDEEPYAIVVIATLGAHQRSLVRRHRPRRPADPAPAEVVTGRATIIDPRPLPDGVAWLRELDGDAEVAGALATLNRVLQAHRIAAADPYAHELAGAQALVIRAGYGAGERVADGRWSEAVELPPPSAKRRRRAAVLRPQERLAALLSARDEALACEELALRARADLDHGRAAAAALEVRVALEAALVELAPVLESPGMSERLDELRDLRDDVIAAANSALAAPLPERQLAAVGHALDRIEAALRARTAARLH
jgi:hypothetical protein